MDKETYSIYNDLFDIERNVLLKKVTGHTSLKNKNIEQFRSSKQVYFIKSHNLPDEDILSDKVIYLIRDGRDATLSFSYYLKQYHQESYLEFNEIVCGLHGFGSWHNHVRFWHAVSKKNILIVKFEDMINDPIKEVNKIAEFVPIKIISKDIIAFSQLQSIDNRFFRKGKINSWKTELNSEENEFFWTKSFKEMIANSYNDGMPEFFRQEQIRNLFQLSDLVVSNIYNKLERKLNVKISELTCSLISSNESLRSENLITEALKEKQKTLKEEYESLKEEKLSLHMQISQFKSDLRIMNEENSLIKKDNCFYKEKYMRIKKMKEVLMDEIIELEIQFVMNNEIIGKMYNDYSIDYIKKEISKF